MTLPRATREPVIVQTFDIAGEKAAQPAALRLLGQANLERSLAFWRDVLGFEPSHTAHQSGEMAREITGVVGAEIKLAVVKVPGGHKIELLEYLAPPERKRHVDLRPCDVGSVHVALIVDDLDAILNAINASGWKAAGKPQTLQSGPNAGKRVVYVRDPDGTTIEFMQATA